MYQLFQTEDSIVNLYKIVSSFHNFYQRDIIELKFFMSPFIKRHSMLFHV